MLAAKPAAKAAWNLAASASPVSMVKSVMLCAWVGGCRACVRGRVFRFRMRKTDVSRKAADEKLVTRG